MGLTKLLQLLVLCNVGIAAVSCKWIDLSFSFENNMVAGYGASSPFKISVTHNGPFLDAPYGYINWFEQTEHVGTHMDAPNHFVKGQIAVDQIPVEKFSGPAVVVNITEKASKDRNALMTISDLEMWERAHGRIPDGSIVVMYSGWGKFWEDGIKYMGLENASDINDLLKYNWPGIGADAAKWLVDNRNINGIGVDSRSLDQGNTTIFPSHQILLAAGIFGLESLANVDKLPAKGAMLFALPMKIKNGSGGPTRVLARIDGDIDNASSTIAGNYVFVILVFCIVLLL